MNGRLYVFLKVGKQMSRLTRCDELTTVVSFFDMTFRHLAYSPDVCLTQLNKQSFFLWRSMNQFFKYQSLADNFVNIEEAFLCFLSKKFRWFLQGKALYVFTYFMFLSLGFNLK